MIYYHIDTVSQCRMLLIYRKGVKDDLTAAEKKTLRKLKRIGDAACPAER